MYNPMGPDPISNTTLMEHHSLLCTNHIVGSSNLDVPLITGDFPEAFLGHPVQSVTVRVLDFPGTKEEPFWVI